MVITPKLHTIRILMGVATWSPKATDRLEQCCSGDGVSFKLMQQPSLFALIKPYSSIMSSDMELDMTCFLNYTAGSLSISLQGKDIM